VVVGGVAGIATGGGARVAVTSVVGEGVVVGATGGRVGATAEFAESASVAGRVVVGVEVAEPRSAPGASASCVSGSGTRGTELDSASETRLAVDDPAGLDAAAPSSPTLPPDDFCPEDCGAAVCEADAG